MGDLVVAVLQLSGGSTWNHPAQSLAVWLQALGGGILRQAFSHKLPHANQVSRFNLKRRINHKTPINTRKMQTFTLQKMIFYLSIFVLFSSINIYRLLNQDVFTWQVKWLQICLVRKKKGRRVRNIILIQRLNKILLTPLADVFACIKQKPNLDNIFRKQDIIFCHFTSVNAYGFKNL